jgi:hypothetical protein
LTGYIGIGSVAGTSEETEEVYHDAQEVHGYTYEDTSEEVM